ncbi:Eco57I restriction-modification methylase domain-containing protein [Phaeospirillum tilakii]|uniref:site-specific DNA-methyltransferase (adenine-specific) n=1 Tax=Phaeospirillum tilakii TaxID=741673 RepID=A0ABW5CAT3_9PROT
MRRPRHPHTTAFDALTVEGALIAPAMLTRISTRTAPQQAETDYGIRKGLNLRDEVARFFRIGQALYADLKASPTPSLAATSSFVEALLREVFEVSDLDRVGHRERDGRTYPLTLQGLGGRLPVVVVPPTDPLDKASPSLAFDGRRRSAASAAQDWLNADPDSLWGLCCNGDRLRLLRDNDSLTRPAFIEADLARMFEADAFADFSALWLLIHASRFGKAGTLPTDCALERWRDAGGKEGAAARERLSEGVEAALLALGSGFLSDTPDLRQRVKDGALPRTAFFGQLLRLVYRLIFLLVAEDRGLLHPPEAPAAARRLYAGGYALSRLRDRAIRRAARDGHRDQWQGLRVVFAALARGEPRLALPALGGLFAPDVMPDLDSAHLSNRALMTAMFHLAWLRDGNGLAPVNWRDMETEELGSVYESLLELNPLLVEDGRKLAFAEGAESKGHARKTSGSYYTPDSLVQTLLDSALDPVLARVEAEAADPVAALLKVSVLDPACGSGHFLLAAARRLATRIARHRAGGVASAEEYRHALRDVARSCLYGVDRNPMAIELAKVALWIETVEPGKPLGFLDANLRCGDSLLGIYDLDVLRQGIPDAAYKPLTGDDKETARHFAKRNRSEREGQGTLALGGQGWSMPAPPPLARLNLDWRILPEDSPEQIADKRRRFEATRADPRTWAWKQACDLYVTAFLTAKTGGVPASHTAVAIPTSGHLWQVLAGHQVHPPLMARALDLAAEARAFHWPLEFPEMFEAGGFDVVLGNPPWERIKLQEQEFFAARAPEIAQAPTAAARGRLIKALADAPEDSRDRRLFAAFETEKRVAEAASVFARVPQEDGGRFPLTGRGDVNTYALFAELFTRLTSPRGRAGLVVPTGIATDATTAPFFAALIENRRLVSLHDFQTGMGFFDRIGHARFKFSLITTCDAGTGPEAPDFSFFSRTMEDFADRRRHFRLDRPTIERLNPNTKTTPVFRTETDAALTARIYSRVSVLIDESKGPAGNPWGGSFMAMLHMANDSGLFRSAGQLTAAGYVRDGTDWVSAAGFRPPQAALPLDGGRDGLHLPLVGGGTTRPADRYVPLYEAKMIHHFDHRWATYDGDECRDATPAEHADPSFEPTPRYWVPEREVRDRLSAKGWTRDWLMGWRDICRATDERTVIASVTPRVAVGHTAPLMFTTAAPRLVTALLGNLSSLVLDYVARQKVGGTHLTYGYLAQFPILPPSTYTEADLAVIVPQVLELTYTSRAMAPFARDLGFDGPPFAWDEERRALLRAELDAWYARAYGLTRDELRFILDPAEVRGADYPSETFRGLKTNEIRRFGEYRTARLVLAAWDRLECGAVHDTSPPIVVSLPTPVRQSRPLPIMSSVVDGAWARPMSNPRGETMEVLLAVLEAMDRPMPAERVRLAVLLALEPYLLGPHLEADQKTDWGRVIGGEAAGPTTDNAELAGHWGAAVRYFRSRRWLDDASGNWRAGDNLGTQQPGDWAAGRAAITWDAMRRIGDKAEIINLFSPQLDRWRNAEAA